MNVFHTSFFNGRTFYHIHEIFWRIKIEIVICTNYFLIQAILAGDEIKQEIKNIFFKVI